MRQSPVHPQVINDGKLSHAIIQSASLPVKFVKKLLLVKSKRATCISVEYNGLSVLDQNTEMSV